MQQQRKRWEQEVEKNHDFTDIMLHQKGDGQTRGRGGVRV